MKKISLIFGLLLLTGLLITNETQAQLVVANENTANILLGTDYNLEATTYNFVETGSGNYHINATFYLTPGNPVIPEKGTNKVDLACSLIIWPPFPNPPLQLTSVSEATINKHGKCHVIFHVDNSEE